MTAIERIKSIENEPRSTMGGLGLGLYRLPDSNQDFLLKAFKAMRKVAARCSDETSDWIDQEFEQRMKE